MKKIIIIGASSGIGRTLAESFARRSCMVGIVARRSSLLISLQQKFPTNIVVSAFDVTEADNLQNINSLIDKIGGLDIFVFCAGWAELSTKPDWSINKKIIELNVTVFTKCTGHIFNYFVEQGTGQIVVITSIAAIRGGASAPAYNASKSFQSSFCESLNLQAANLKKDIIITDIKPGYVQTEMAKGSGAFWIMPLDKVCKQIDIAIRQRRKKVIITKRWMLIAFFLKYTPDFVYRYISKKVADK